MSHRKPPGDSAQGSQTALRTIINLKTHDQSSDLGKAINVFKPKDVANPFLGQSKQAQAPKVQPAENQPAQEKK